MADINLLQNQLKDTTQISNRRTQAVMVVLLILLVLIVGASVGLYFLTSQEKTATADLSQTNTQLQRDLTSRQKDLTDAQNYQAKLTNINTLLKNHIAVSPVLQELSTYTYQKAQFVSLDVDQATGKIHLEGTTASYVDLGKVLLGLSTSSHLKDVKLLSILPTTGKVNGFSFSIDMVATSDLFSNK